MKARKFFGTTIAAMGLFAIFSGSEGGAAPVCPQGGGNEAIKICSDFILQHPNDANAYFNRAMGYSDIGDFDAAIADNTKAISLDPKLSGAYANRGLAYYSKRDFDKAILDENQAISLDPKLSEAFNGRALAYESKGDNDRALADYTRSINFNPKYDTGYINRGVLRFERDEFEQAVADESAAIGLKTKQPLAYFFRGKAYFRMNDFDRAIADFTQVTVMKAPDRYNFGRGEWLRMGAYSWRRDAYAVKGDFSKAMVDADQVVSLRPDDGYSYYFRGLIKLYSGAPAPALEDFIRAEDPASKPVFKGALVTLGDTAPAPLGWVNFCKESSSECTGGKSEPRDIIVTENVWRDLGKVNRWANDNVKPAVNRDRKLVTEKWAFPTDDQGGDAACALLKRRMLMQAGWPREALLMTIVRDRNNGSHTVLTVKTDRGEFILDDRSANIVVWHHTAYELTERQSQADPNVWITIGAKSPVEKQQGTKR